MIDKNGKLIVIEGACDCIGKTTQYQMLCKHLEKDGIKIITHHFPSYNTYQGIPTTKYLRGEYGNIDELSPYFINSLYATDRAITYQTKLKEPYENGQMIILDRYTTSSLIYQSSVIKNMEEKKAFIDFVADYEYNKLGIAEPDKVIFLNAPFDLAYEIRKKRTHNDGVANDIHEKDLEYLRKVYENALFIADYLSWDKIECGYNNTMRTEDDIHDEVYTLIKK